jgi:transcriptional regulator with XRE-family HTH domain
MPRALDEISLEHLSRTLRSARERKGWTLEQLSHELWHRGLPTSQNKLWRLENNPPHRLDTELLLWLEKVLDVELISADEKKQVLIEDVLGLIDSFIATSPRGSIPAPPDNQSLHEIHNRLKRLVRAR